MLVIVITLKVFNWKEFTAILKAFIRRVLV